MEVTSKIVEKAIEKYFDELVSTIEYLKKVIPEIKKDIEEIKKAVYGKVEKKTDRKISLDDIGYRGREIGRVVFGVLEEKKVPNTTCYEYILRRLQEFGLLKITGKDDKCIYVEIKDREALESIRNELLMKGYRPRRLGWWKRGAYYD